MRWIPWIVLGVLAAGAVLIFSKSAPRAPLATLAKNSPTSPAPAEPAPKTGDVVAVAAFSATADTGSARRNSSRRDTAFAAYNQEANQAEETAPADANATADAASSAPASSAPVGSAPVGSDDPTARTDTPAGEGATGQGIPPHNGALPAREDMAAEAPGVGPVPAETPPAEHDPAVHPLPSPRPTFGKGDNGPLSSLDPPIGARGQMAPAHDSAHQPYYPSAKPLVAGPLPRRNTEAWEAIHRKAAMKAEMRGRRLTTQKWFGYSNLRPTASATPFLSTYSPTWTGNTAHPAYWTGVR